MVMASGGDIETVRMHSVAIGVNPAQNKSGLLSKNRPPVTCNSLPLFKLLTMPCAREFMIMQMTKVKQTNWLEMYW